MWPGFDGDTQTLFYSVIRPGQYKAPTVAPSIRYGVIDSERADLYIRESYTTHRVRFLVSQQSFVQLRR